MNNMTESAATSAPRFGVAYAFLVLSVVAVAGCRKSESGSEGRERVTAAGSQAVRSPLDRTADLVLGQANPVSNGFNQVKRNSLSEPTAVALDNSVSPPRIFVADTQNNRVLGWNNAEAYASGADADLIIGFNNYEQNSYATAVSQLGNGGCFPSASNAVLCRPSGVAVDESGSLYVADTNFHRVLAFDRPFETDTLADRVFGQPTFTTATANINGLSASTLNAPTGVALDSDALWVVDRGNNRILRYNQPGTSDAVADVVLGQPSMLLNNPNGPDSRGYDLVRDIAVDTSVTPNRLWVADLRNNRVLGYTSTEFENGEAASIVLGQIDMTTKATTLNGAVNAKTMNQPSGIAVDSFGNVFVSDAGHARILGYANPWDPNFMPGKSGDAIADKVWGQPNFTSSATPLVSSITASTLANPNALTIAPNGDLLVADTNTSRVLRYNLGGQPHHLFSDTLPDTVADAVWGQPNFTSGVIGQNACPWAVTASTLCHPSSVRVDAAGNLYVFDDFNFRVVIYHNDGNTVADVVIGQQDFVTAENNRGGATGPLTLGSQLVASRMLGGLALSPSGGLWVGDGGNARVLYFADPLVDQSPDAIIGQSSYTSTDCNYISNSSRTCFWTHASNFLVPALDSNNQLLVAGYRESRVVGFEDPLVNDAIADRVIGQPDFQSNVFNSADATFVQSPWSLYVDKSSTPHKLYVADAFNNRVVVWSLTPGLNSGDPAMGVLGQPDINSSARNANGISASSMFTNPIHEPGGTPLGFGAITGDSAGNIYVSDSANNRVLRYDAPFSPGGDREADAVYGQADFASGNCNRGGSASANTLCRPIGLAATATGDHLWVVDALNHRVLRFDGSSTTASAALGQPDLTSRTANSATASSLSPQVDNRALLYGQTTSTLGIGIDTIRGRLYVADTGNSRVLAWASLEGLSNGQAPDVILGQVGTSSQGCNRGSLTVASADSMCEPQGLGVDASGRLFVSDTANNRILVFNDPFASQTADAVFGQPDFVSNAKNAGSASVSANGLAGPVGISIQSDQTVWVADTGNSRILGFSDPLNGNDFTADYVVGQTNFTSGYCNGKSGTYATVATPARDTLCYPRGARIDESTATLALWVADTKNHRILRFDNPEVDSSPDHLLGQPVGQWTSGVASNAVNRLNSPNDIILDHLGGLYIAEHSRGGVTYWAAPRAASPVSTSMYGQLNTTAATCNGSGLATAATGCNPTSLALDQFGGLWVTDSGNSRVLAYYANSRPTSTGLTLSPATPNTTDDLVSNASASYADADADAQGLSTIRWYRNGAEVTALLNAATVPASETARDDEWYYTYQPNDGIQTGQVYTSPTITISNAAPVAATLALVNTTPRTDDDLELDYDYADLDLDDESGTQIRWYRNNAEQATYRDERTIPASSTQKGDLWYFTVTPSDGTTSGALVTSNVYTIGNTLPVASVPAVFPAAPTVLDNLTATYLFLDADADGAFPPEVRWYRNGVLESVLNDQTTIQGPFTYTDSWHFTLRAHDGSGYGNLVTSAPVTFVSSAPEATALEILPGTPNTTSTLTADYLFTDPDNQTELNSEIHWFRNGSEEVTLLNSMTVPPTATTRGETWHFTVRPSDGAVLGALRTSAGVTIQNSPPTASNVITTPASPVVTNSLSTSYTFADDDGDAQSGSQIHWFRNGLEVTALANQNLVAGSNLRKGEVWYYRVAPSDGSAAGPEETSVPVIIQNSAPIANAGPDLTLAATGTNTQVTLTGAASTDADGDVLSYKWLSGLSVVGTGVTLELPLAMGTHTFTLEVTDGSQTSTDTLTLTLEDPKPVVTSTTPSTVNPGHVALTVTVTEPLSRAVTYAWTQTGGPAVTLDDPTAASPSFFALTPGTRTFEVVATVQAGTAASTPVTISVTVNDVAPVAFVPKRVATAVGTAVLLDGQASTDANGQAITYKWTVASGPGDFTFVSDTASVASFSGQADGAYTVQLVVNDGTQDSAPASMTVLVVSSTAAHVPSANAGLDAVTGVGTAVTLDGTGSYDLDGQALSYKWKILSGTGGKLTRSSTAKPEFVATSAGTFNVELSVTDATTTVTDTVQVQVVGANADRPTARVSAAGSAVGSPVTLSGTTSSDPNGDTLTYTWRQVSGLPLELMTPNGNTCQVYPLRPGSATFELTVFDGVNSHSAQTTVVFVSSGNQAPLASASGPSTALVQQPVQLDGSASSDPEAAVLRYVWEQTAGTPVQLSDLSSATPTFQALAKGEYTFSLTVWDNESPSLPSKVTVSVGSHSAGSNQRPVAVVAAQELEADVNALVTLDGTGSNDPDALDKLTYQWTAVGFPSGVAPVLTSANAATASFTPDKAGLYTFALTVSDGELTSAPVFVRVEVGGQGGTGRGCTSAPGASLFWMLPVLFGIRRRRNG